MRFVDLLLAELQQFGCKSMFGIPGDFILPLLQELQSRNQLPFYSLNHEPSVVYAADAAARSAGAPSAALLTYGAGALNAVNAVAQAYVERVPLIVIAGFPSRHEIDRELAIHHQAKSLDSQRRVFAEVTELQVRLDDPVRAAGQLRAALQCCYEQSRPVLIEVPRDAIHFQCLQLPPYHTSRMPTHEQQLLVETIAKRLAKAQRPVLLAGIEVQRFAAGEALENLALQLNIPLLTTFLARAAIAPDHPCFHGTFIDHDRPANSQTHPHQLLQESDLIIHLGVIVNDTNFAAYPEFAKGEKVMQLHQGITHFAERRFYDVQLADLCQALTAEHLPRHHSWYPEAIGRTSNIDPTQPAPGWDTTTLVELIDVELTQQAETVPLISDIGDCLFASLHAHASQLLAPAYYASMGYSIPAALGVHVSTGLRSVVLVGDGAFLMTGLELGRLHQYGADPIIILLNNGSWDMIEAFSPGLDCAPLPACDLLAIAAAQGARTQSASCADGFLSAFQKAWNEPGCMHVIEVQLKQRRSRRLQGFAERFVQGSSLQMSDNAAASLQT
ncbi:Indole-3-pyruvate decarboxylase [Pseudidiomarina piscicola]|uniref:Indole-3-pyruvate decarboxylase n=1 Tax=Pseudidiomarina piscicola TaxID=2614830 RepID=A0A6S6WS85_9GAMM|nr:thiamine pyrophosphate-binding protein [Pseudidiomarina piscicola]CAB0151495.1 Indole-3-pyruvate decarboxylase [Pseudidiomarina piscicola]VZT40974.1 Indole-3-pyruvate decarboxylase [Pseudomonas aeruginosa]